MKKIWLHSYITINLIIKTHNAAVSVNNLNKEFRHLISIYYNPPFEKPNNSTGTGNLLKDQAYKSVCLILNCTTSCCSGDINIMTCGTTQECFEYNSYYNVMIIVLAIIGSFVFFVILVIIVNLCYKQLTFGESVSYTLSILAIVVFFPISLVVLLIRHIIQADKDKLKVDK
jgi:hypothetical protein